MFDEGDTTWGAVPNSETQPSPRRPSGPGDDDGRGALPAGTARGVADEGGGEDRDGEPRKIGPYVVRRLLGEGGFGQVYLADQVHPVRRQVAVKIIKPGMASDGLVARFEQERQALAVMNHPGVAKVYDGGVTDADSGRGQPYFVMEYVDGQPLVKFADAQRMTLRERVQLMIQVAEAVHHAHVKGVIHRDLKPGNILARMVDGKPKATVIDFGVAKALRRGEEGFSEDVVTEVGQVIGSRDYMSPEQAGGQNPDDIDTRADVYALGVVLYELITGVTPFDRNALRSASFVELQRIIQMVDPAKPSTRFRDLRATTLVEPDPRFSPETLAYHRRADERAMSRLLRGELDWICMRCLEKDRDRRYDTAGDLAEELERFLAGEAVLAGPPSGWYRAKKFVRRNRAGVAAAGFGLAALIGATGVSGAFGLSEARQRALADEARENLEVVVDFQADMLGEVDRTRMGDSIRAEMRSQIMDRLARRGATGAQVDEMLSYFEGTLGLVETAALAMSVIQENMLGDAVVSIDERHGSDPVLQAGLRQTVGDTYLALGVYEPALEQFELALATREAELGSDHPDTLETVNSIGLLLRQTGDLAGARERFERSLEGLRRVLGSRNRETLNAMGNLSEVLLAMGRPADALPYAQEAVSGLRAALGDRHPDSLSALNILGTALEAAGSLDRAEAALREAMEGRREVLGPQHQQTLTSVHNRSLLMQKRGDFPEAFRYAVAAMDGRRTALGDRHPDTLSSIANLGRLYQATNRSAEALPLLAEAAAGFLEIDGYGAMHPRTVTVNSLLAGCLLSEGRAGEAEALYRDVLAKRRELLPAEHPDTLGTMTSLASVLIARGEAGEAEPLQRGALRAYRATLGPEHAATLRAQFNLGYALERTGDLEEAERLYADTAALARAGASADGLRAEHPELGQMLHRHGYVLGVLGRFEDAAPVLEEANAVLVRTRGERFRLTLENTATLAGLYRQWDSIEPGGGHAEDAALWLGRLNELRSSPAAAP